MPFWPAAGGGGEESITTYTGTTSQATLDSAKSNEITKASAEATIESLDSENIPAVFKTSGKLESLKSTSLDILHYQTIQGVCDSGNVDASGTETNAIITYSNCTINNFGDVITVNGRAIFTGDLYGTFTFRYTNFSLSINGYSSTIENLTFSCTDGFYSGTCTMSSDYTGFDGKVYRVENYTVTYDYLNADYSVSGRIYHPDYGYTEISGSLTIGTCSGIERPINGTMTITGANGTASIAFIDCDSFSIDFDGSTTPANW